MSHLPFTLAAYFLNATAVLIDKFLLTKSIPNPLVYIFYFSAFSLIGLLPLPFTHIPTLEVFILASASTALWTTGAYFMFKALQIGQASRVIPIIGTLVPTLLLSEAIISKTVTTNQILAIIFLLSGLIFLTFLDWKTCLPAGRGKVTKKELFFEILSASLFAVSYLILRQAYIKADFLTVFVWSRFVIIPVSLIILIIPKLRKMVFSSQGNSPAFSLISKAGLLFLIGQSAGGSSELLLTYSISLATPALVNSLQGTQYAFLFLASLFLAHKFPEVFKEKMSTLGTISKILGIIFIGGGLYLLAK